MRYLLAILFPPLALILCGRPIQAVISGVWIAATIAVSIVGSLLIVGAIGWIGVPLVIFHAVLVVHQEDADIRNRELIIALGRTPPPLRRGEVSVFNNLVLVLGGMIIAGGLALWLMYAARPEGTSLKLSAFGRTVTIGKSITPKP